MHTSSLSDLARNPLIRKEIQIAALGKTFNIINMLRRAPCLNLPSCQVIWDRSRSVRVGSVVGASRWPPILPAVRRVSLPQWERDVAGVRDGNSVGPCGAVGQEERERLFHGVRKKRDGAGWDEPAADAVFDEFRDSSDVGRYDGALQGEGFHDDDREAFGKAGEE